MIGRAAGLDVGDAAAVVGRIFQRAAGQHIQCAAGNRRSTGNRAAGETTGGDVLDTATEDTNVTGCRPQQIEGSTAGYAHMIGRAAGPDVRDAAAVVGRIFQRAAGQHVQCAAGNRRSTGNRAAGEATGGDVLDTAAEDRDVAGRGALHVEETATRHAEMFGHAARSDIGDASTEVRRMDE